MTKGVYLLLIQVNMDIQVDVGALGTVNFEKGLYVYVGSAQNSLEKRVERHLKKNKQKFWHIDYLLANEHANVVRVFYKKRVDKTEECKTAKKLSEMGAPILGFGSSDCKCKSHLIKIKGYQFLKENMHEMKT